MVILVLLLRLFSSRQKIQELKKAQQDADAKAKDMCSEYALTKPIDECTAGSTCRVHDKKMAEEETSFLSLAKQEWAKITAAQAKTEQFVHQLKNVQGIINETSAAIKVTEGQVTAARVSRAAEAAQHSVDMAEITSALSTVDRLKNYVQVSERVDSSHDFVVPLYNAQGKNTQINTLIDGAIKVVLDEDIPSEQRKARYEAMFAELETQLTKMDKEMSLLEPQRKIKFDTITLPALVKEIQTAQQRLADLEGQKAVLLTQKAHHASNLPTDTTYHTVLLERYNKAKAARAKNLETCVTAMHSFAVQTTSRNKELREIEAATLTPEQLAAKAAENALKFTTAPTPSPESFCPEDEKCQGTIDSPCRMVWDSIHGSKLCLWSVTTDRRQASVYQQPGWLPVYPACIHQDSVGCMLRNNAELSTIRNPTTSDVAEYSSAILNKFGKSFDADKLQNADDAAKALAVCTAVPDSVLYKSDDCYVPGCGTDITNPCMKTWRTVSGKKVCLYSDVTEHRMDPAKENVGWMPYCPAALSDEMVSCVPRDEQSEIPCNPKVLLQDNLSQKGAGVALQRTQPAPVVSSTPCTPVDCETTPFTAWGTCTKSCGGGVQYRTRTVLKAPACGGAVCGHLSQLQQCNVGTCSDDCQVSEYGDWGACSKSCDGGFQTRSRAITQRGKGNCPMLTETRTCNVGICGSCSHVKCQMIAREVGTSEHRTVRVMHHNQEQNGDKHDCAFNVNTKACQCKCSNSK
jgi:hypothetical protein